jgi:hypothetical protein
LAIPRRKRAGRLLIDDLIAHQAPGHVTVLAAFIADAFPCRDG